MKQLLPDETELTCHWNLVAGKMVADATCSRIQWHISEHLKKLTTDASGWLSLYRDPRDARLWELSYPHGEMHGGGPPKLACITPQRAKATYGHDTEY